MDRRMVVCIKPAGVLSTDEPGGLSDLLRQQMGEPQGCFRTVHRLDRVVSGLMVLARSAKAASLLSQQIRQRHFEKEYLAVIHGCPPEQEGRMVDLLARSRQTRTTYVTDKTGKDVQTATLSYKVLRQTGELSLVKIVLETGRTHQIRCQFSSRGLPLVGDQKYGTGEDACPIALWSYHLAFSHPETGEAVEFTAPPPDRYPWNSI